MQRLLERKLSLIAETAFDNCLSADVLNHYDDGQLASSCALAPAAGHNSVLFLTLADETGNVNVIVWPSLVEQQLREVIGANFLGVYGQ